MPLINCEMELDLPWSRYCIISEISRTPPAPANPTVPATEATHTTRAKLYVPVVTLSINNNIKFLENIKQGFKRTISWNKYRSEITTQPKNNNLDYLINPTFVLSFKNGDNDPERGSFHKYYMLLVETKDFNVLIDNKPCFDQTVKNKQETYEKLIDMSRNDDYTTGYLLDF